MRVFYAYLTMMATFIFLDLIWLGVVAKNFYRNNLDHLLATTVNWWAAIVFYVLFLVGILLFVVIPLQNDNFLKTLLYGAFFGLVTYGAYDLTNMATLKQWPAIIVIVDMTWGAFICATISLVGRQVI